MTDGIGGARAKQFAFTGIGALCVLGGLWRMVALASQGDPPDSDVLLFMLAAVAAVLAESVTKFSFGGLTVERLNQLTERVDEIAEVTMDQGGALRPDPLAEDAATKELSTKERSTVPAGESLEAAARQLERAIYLGDLNWQSDPVLDHGPGPSDRPGGLLRAEVQPSKSNPAVFKVDIRCDVSAALLAARRPRVAFFLHQTFQNRVRIVRVVEGAARLSLWSLGTFTVGVLFADGTWTRLNLAEADLEGLTAAQRQKFLDG